MVCHQCHGQHWVIRGGQMCPCPECGGLGEVHCCEGLVAQRDYADLSPRARPPVTEETVCVLPPYAR